MACYGKEVSDVALKIGLHAGPQDCSYQDLRRIWHMADASGFHWVSVWDHFYESPVIDGRSPCFEGVSIMTALAAETRNVRVGCLVFCVGTRSPGLLAKAAVTIDHVSNGRLELGIGYGPWEPEYRAYGHEFPPLKTQMDVLEEGCQVIRSMMHNETTTFEGRHFQVRDARVFPRPVQDPPRLWIAGIGEKRILPMVARYADGWNATYITTEAFKSKSRLLDGLCEAEGRDPSEVIRSANVGFYMGADEKSALRKRREFERVWAHGESGPDDPKFDESRDYLSEFEQGMIFGTANDAIERIGALADAGADQVNISVRAPFDWDGLQAFVEDVMPAFN